MKSKKITAILSALIILSSSIPFANATPSIIESEKSSPISKIPDDDSYFSMIVSYDEVYSRAELLYRGFEIIDGNKEMFVYKMPKNMEELDLLIEDYEKWGDTSQFGYKYEAPNYSNDFPLEMPDIRNVLVEWGAGGDPRNACLWRPNRDLDIPYIDSEYLENTNYWRQYPISFENYKWLDKYMSWCKNNSELFYIGSYDTTKEEKISLPTSPTSFSQYANLYYFYSQNVLTDEEFLEFIQFLSECNAEDFFNGIISEYIFNPELIKAIIDQNEEKVIEFCYPQTLVKGTKFYTPEWIYYSTIEDYKKEGITPFEIAEKIPSYREITFHDDGRYIGDLQFQALEKKLYLYAKECGDFDSIANICDYSRDWDMPLPYFVRDRFPSYMADNYFAFILRLMLFQNESISFDSSCNSFYDLDAIQASDLIIKKGDKHYSMEWVYYNTTKAYEEAGITKTELLAMLPKYSSICLLSEEALNALKNKIDSYDFEDEISNAEAFTFIPGDIQATGEIELSDVIYLKKSFLEFPEYKLSIAISDMNGDNVFDLSDIIAVKKVFIGISENRV